MEGLDLHFNDAASFKCGETLLRKEQAPISLAKHAAIHHCDGFVRQLHDRLKRTTKYSDEPDGLAQREEKFRVVRHQRWTEVAPLVQTAAGVF